MPHLKPPGTDDADTAELVSGNHGPQHHQRLRVDNGNPALPADHPRPRAVAATLALSTCKRSAIAARFSLRRRCTMPIDGYHASAVAALRHGELGEPVGLPPSIFASTAALGRGIHRFRADAPSGTPEEDFDCACGPALNDPTAAGVTAPDRQQSDHWQLIFTRSRLVRPSPVSDRIRQGRIGEKPPCANDDMAHHGKHHRSS
mgnify:CR=1 FL=1